MIITAVRTAVFSCIRTFDLRFIFTGIFIKRFIIGTSRTSSIGLRTLCTGTALLWTCIIIVIHISLLRARITLLLRARCVSIMLTRLLPTRAYINAPLRTLLRSVSLLRALSLLIIGTILRINALVRTVLIKPLTLILGIRTLPLLLLWALTLLVVRTILLADALIRTVLTCVLPLLMINGSRTRTLINRTLPLIVGTLTLLLLRTLCIRSGIRLSLHLLRSSFSLLNRLFFHYMLRCRSSLLLLYRLPGRVFHYQISNRIVYSA